MTRKHSHGALVPMLALLLGLSVPWDASAQNAPREAAALAQQLNSSAAAGRAAAVKVDAKLTPAQSASLRKLGAEFARTGDAAALKRGWRRFITAAKPAEGDVNGLVQAVLGPSYQVSAEDLKRHTQRGSATKARLPARELRVGSSVAQGNVAQAGEDGQLANLELQDALQKQQQSLQTLSNLSKSLHDTAMAIIRKVGG